jgi:hypothetical protein
MPLGKPGAVSVTGRGVPPRAARLTTKLAVVPGARDWEVGAKVREKSQVLGVGVGAEMSI